MSAESLDDLRVDLLVCDDNALIALHGEIDVSNRSQLTAPLATAVRDRVNAVIDLSEVAFMDIGGVRLIVDAEKELALAGRRLLGVHPQPAVRRVITLLGAGHLLRPLSRRRRGSHHYAGPRCAGVRSGLGLRWTAAEVSTPSPVSLRVDLTHARSSGVDASFHAKRHR